MSDGRTWRETEALRKTLFDDLINLLGATPTEEQKAAAWRHLDEKMEDEVDFWFANGQQNAHDR